MGIVAAWRVVLMMRVVAVLYDAKPWQAICVVMLFADALALAILRLTPLPVVSIMGGIRLSESEQLIQATTFWVAAAGLLSFPIWLIGTVVAAACKNFSWRTATSALAGQRRVAPVAWSFGAAALLIWIPVLPWTQPEQQLRRVVEKDLREGKSGKHEHDVGI